MSLLVPRFVVAAAIGIAFLAAALGLGAEPAPEEEAEKVVSVVVTPLQAFSDNKAAGAF